MKTHMPSHTTAWISSIILGLAYSPPGTKENTRTAREGSTRSKKHSCHRMTLQLDETGRASGSTPAISSKGNHGSGWEVYCGAFTKCPRKSNLWPTTWMLSQSEIPRPQWIRQSLSEILQALHAAGWPLPGPGNQGSAKKSLLHRDHGVWPAAVLPHKFRPHFWTSLSAFCIFIFVIYLFIGGSFFYCHIS